MRERRTGAEQRRTGAKQRRTGALTSLVCAALRVADVPWHSGAALGGRRAKDWRTGGDGCFSSGLGLSSARGEPGETCGLLLRPKALMGNLALWMTVR